LSVFLWLIGGVSLAALFTSGLLSLFALLSLFGVLHFLFKLF